MSELKCRTIWESRTQRWMIIMMPCRLVLGLLVLNAVVASPPRYTRQTEPDYDVDLNHVDDYYEDLTTDEPEIEISPLSPDEGHEASLEEEEEELEGEHEKESGDKEELPITPLLMPSGSGVLTEPDAPAEEELRLAPTEILHISGDFVGSGDMLRSGGSGASGASGISGKIPDAKEYHSGEPLGSGGSGVLCFGGSAYLCSGDISSEGSVDLGSGISGELVSGVSDDFVSGVSEDLVSVVSGDFVSKESGDLVSGASGGFVSGASGGFVSGASGDIVSGISGVSEDFVPGVSGDVDSGISEDSVSGALSLVVSGDIVFRASGDVVLGFSGDILSGASGDHVPEVSGETVSGASGDSVPEVSGEIVSGASGDRVPEVSGEIVSGASGDRVPEVSGEIVSGASGDRVSEVSGEIVSGASGDRVPEVSGEIVSGASGGNVSGDFEEHISGVSGDVGSGPSGDSGEEITLVPGREEEIYITITTGPEEASGVPGESGEPEKPLTPLEPVTPGPPDEWVTISPTLKEEEELFPTTQTPTQEGTGSTTGSGLPESPDPDVDVEIDVQGMPTCILCTCLGGSVYCDDVKLLNVPPLPKDTTHFYARFNRITKINKSDFANMNKLKRIDLTSNYISKIENGAFFGLPALEELVIRENSLAQLPALPASMSLIDASHNHLGRTGIQNEAFKDMSGLLYLYLTDNSIDHIPVPLPESLRSLHLQNNNIQMMHEDTFCKQNDLNYIRMALEDIRLDANPINLSRTPQAYVCLPRVPVGALF